MNWDEATAERYRRNAAIVRDYTHGGMTMQQVAANYGITKQRVSQIVKAARRAEVKARCASGEHGALLTRGYDLVIDGVSRHVDVY